MLVHTSIGNYFASDPVSTTSSCSCIHLLLFAMTFSQFIFLNSLCPSSCCCLFILNLKHDLPPLTTSFQIFLASSLSKSSCWICLLWNCLLFGTRGISVLENACEVFNSRLLWQIFLLFDKPVLCYYLWLMGLLILWDYCVQELLKREGSKNRAGVSFMFVIFVGLLGIILGYLMKKS